MINQTILNEKLNTVNHFLGSGETVVSYEIDISLNSYKLVKIETEGRAQKTILHASSKRELFEKMQSFLIGIQEYLRVKSYE